MYYVNKHYAENSWERFICQNIILHSSTCKLLKHLLGIWWLAEWHHVACISHNQQVQIVSLCQVPDYFTIVVVNLTLSFAAD